MNSKRILFRADASLQIGTGHIMRCLTLADALRERGAECRFICREHPGNLIELIRSKGYLACALPALPHPPSDGKATASDSSTAELAHSHWLGATQFQDAEACASVLAAYEPDWLIVDHYALDASWERALASHYRKLMVIDDLADRPHACDLLLDQTFGREAADYRLLVPADCHLLCGSRYALLRPEFAALRTYSLQRRAEPKLRRLLVSMGGVDKDNVTGRVLDALRSCPLPADCEITVVMGSTAPWFAGVERQAKGMPWTTTARAGVSNMAQLMADSDLAIGAAGATSWERCCLGLPTIMITVAQNQKHAAERLEAAGAAQILTDDANLLDNLRQLIRLCTATDLHLRKLSASATDITDGLGAPVVVRTLMSGVPE